MNIKLKRSELNSYMDKYNDEFLFSGTVSVKKGDDIIFQKGYGFASAEHCVLNTVDTVFKLYSISKQFTAAAVLLLEEKGLLKLSDKLLDYFPKVTNFNKNITLYHLLTHTSGIFNYSNIELSHTKIYNLHLSNDEMISLFKDKTLSFEPGTDYEYCNSGYFLLSLIIEKVSGLSYEEFLNENIFKPLNMNYTYVDEGKKIIKNMATGYYINYRNLVHCNYIDMNNCSYIEVYENDDNLYFRLNKCNVFLIYPISEDTFQNELLDETYKVEYDGDKVLSFWGVEKFNN